ncbi:MAG: hypothetical protein EON59_01655 [Alphaproteobacteria bacterium]|nr:MAG: hypothetical protein EON59_01655 [Alphaproteobacteria bacterium]
MQHDYKRPLDRLIYARCLLADWEQSAGDALMSYVFEEDKLDRVVRLQRQRDRILFNAKWVKDQQIAGLVEQLQAMAKRVTG